jgi:D-lactate dehydrogenase
MRSSNSRHPHEEKKMKKIKITAFASRPDEAPSFARLEKELNLDVTHVKAGLSLDSVAVAEGSDGVTFLGNCDVSAPVLEKLASMGIKYAASRSAGYNNVDIETAKRLGIHVSNARYSPDCVADFSLMLALMVNRRIMVALKRNICNDFSFPGIMGREMKNMTVGVMGTGRIGRSVVRDYTGFGCRIIACDVFQSPEVAAYATYVDKETLFKEADIISLHMPLNDQTRHLINEKSIAMMKDGVVIVNAARGELIDTDALIAGLKSRKVGGAGLDVVEGELGIYHTDRRLSGIDNDRLAILISLDNVVTTGHIAFYTEQAVDDMVYCGLNSIVQFITTGKADCEVTC